MTVLLRPSPLYRNWATASAELCSRSFSIRNWIPWGQARERGRLRRVAGTAGRCVPRPHWSGHSGSSRATRVSLLHGQSRSILPATEQARTQTGPEQPRDAVRGNDGAEPRGPGDACRVGREPFPAPPPLPWSPRTTSPAPPPLKMTLGPRSGQTELLVS